MQIHAFRRNLTDMNLTLGEIRDEVQNATTNRTEVERKWLSIPSAVRYSDLSRSKLYLILPKLRTVCLRDEDKLRGTRLIYLPSLDAYLSKFEGIKSEPVAGPKGRKKKPK
jgi:hypothetical protein